jgi:hypothetical protein
VGPIAEHPRAHRAQAVISPRDFNLSAAPPIRFLRTVTFAHTIGDDKLWLHEDFWRGDDRPSPDFRSMPAYFPEPAPPPAWLPMLLVLLPPAEGVCLPLLSLASFCMFDDAPVVMPLVAGPRDEGPTSPLPDALGAGCVCAKAPPVASAMMHADAKMNFFIWFPPGFTSGQPARGADVPNWQRRENRTNARSRNVDVSLHGPYRGRVWNIRLLV